MKTVCFITPPSPFLLDERVFPSLGVLKVAAAAEELGYHVEHLDLNGVANYTDVVENYIAANPDTCTFAITATTPQMVAVDKIRQVLWPDARVILGGPHPTLVHAAVKHSTRAVTAMNKLRWQYDVVVAGDGELVIGAAVESTQSHLLIDADDPKSVGFMTAEQVTAAPLPARHLIDLETYRYVMDGVQTTPLIGQLGCPFGCNFCAGRDSAMLRRVRLRPSAAVVEEMRQIYVRYGVRGFMFFDDELNVNKDLMQLLAGIEELQQRLGVELRCRGFVKAELFTEAQALAMWKAGFRKLMCGFESGSERVLTNINKRATRDDNTRAMEISHKYGLGMKALMSLGHPGESEGTVQATRDWLLSVRPEDFDCTIITAYPGSPYYDRARYMYDDVWVFETNGDRLYMQDVDYTQTEDFYKGSMDGYKSYVWTDYLKADELVRLRDGLEREVRAGLGIAFNPARPAQRFEASMGQLPGCVYRRSDGGENATTTNTAV